MVKAYGSLAPCGHQDPRGDKKVPLQKAQGIRYADPILPPEAAVARAEAITDPDHFDGPEHVECVVLEPPTPALVSNDALTASANE